MKTNDEPILIKTDACSLCGKVAELKRFPLRGALLWLCLDCVWDESEIMARAVLKRLLETPAPFQSNLMSFRAAAHLPDSTSCVQHALAIALVRIQELEKELVAVKAGQTITVSQ